MVDNLWTQEEVEKRILATLKKPVQRAMELRECLEQCWHRDERIRELEAENEKLRKNKCIFS